VYIYVWIFFSGSSRDAGKKWETKDPKSGLDETSFLDLIFMAAWRVRFKLIFTIVFFPLLCTRKGPLEYLQIIFPFYFEWLNRTAVYLQIHPFLPSCNSVFSQVGHGFWRMGPKSPVRQQI
jgi:hypothetical protein